MVAVVILYALAMYITSATVCVSKGYATECLTQTDFRPVTQDVCVAHAKIMIANAIKSFKANKIKGPFISTVDCKLKDATPVVVKPSPPAPSHWYDGLVSIIGWIVSIIF